MAGPAAMPDYFDIDFDADPDGKLVLPVLGAPLDEILERGELRVVAEDGRAPARVLRRAVSARGWNIADG